VVVNLEAYSEVSGLVEVTLGEISLSLSRTKAPRAEEIPMNLLRWIGGPLFRRQLPARLDSFRGPGVTILVSPHGLTIEGREYVVTHVHGLIAEALTFSPALQTLDPAAQKMERRLKSLAQPSRNESDGSSRLPLTHRPLRRALLDQPMAFQDRDAIPEKVFLDRLLLCFGNLVPLRPSDDPDEMPAHRAGDVAAGRWRLAFDVLGEVEHRHGRIFEHQLELFRGPHECESMFGPRQCDDEHELILPRVFQEILMRTLNR